jgi:4-hydroxy-2-oxoheptanedioate aldolase
LTHDAIPFRQRVLGGETVLGMFINLGSPVAAELCGQAGFDYLILDMEHGLLTEANLLAMLHATDSTPATPVVRVEEGTRLRVGRVLDMGAPALMIPQVKSAEEAARVVSFVRYPPTGARGIALPTRGAGFGDVTHAGVATAHENITLMIQIEGRSALEQADEIAAIDGVDVLFVGPTDLSHALGVPGDVTAAPYLNAVERVSKAATGHGKAAGVLLWNLDQLDQYRELGYTVMSIGSDGGYIAAGARAAAQGFKQRQSG